MIITVPNFLQLIFRDFGKIQNNLTTLILIHPLWPYHTLFFFKFGLTQQDFFTSLQFLMSRSCLHLKTILHPLKPLGLIVENTMMMSLKYLCFLYYYSFYICVLSRDEQFLKNPSDWHFLLVNFHNLYISSTVS